MNTTVLESIKKFFFRKILKRKIGGTMPPKESEELEKQFLSVRSSLSPIALTPLEEADIHLQLQYLTAKMPTRERVALFISTLAGALRTKKDESSARSIKWLELFKSGDLPTLIEDFDSNFFGMMCAINDGYASYLQSRLYYSAKEIADRLGGTDFILALDVEMQKNTETGKF